MRLFVAIELAEPFRKRLIELQDALRRLEPAISYIRPENLHLTVKFVGEFEETKLPQLCASLKEIPKVGQFSMSLIGLDFLPERGPIRIIAAAIDGGDNLEALRRTIDAACAKHNVPSENRRFRPHITLARARRPLPRSAKSRLASCFNPMRVQSKVDEFVLVQSNLSDKGSEYVRLQHVEI